MLVRPRKRRSSAEITRTRSSAPVCSRAVVARSSRHASIANTNNRSRNHAVPQARMAPPENDDPDRTRPTPTRRTVSHMRFSISIPQQAPDGTFDPVALRAYLRRAEELGFEGAWTGEQTLGTLPHLGPIETLSFAAACTDRIRLGCAVFVASQH